MATSRSPLRYLERQGIVPTRRVPRPRLDTTDLLVHTIPLTDDQLNPALMLGTKGMPSPDRGRMDPWPPPQEVSDVE